MKGVTMFDKILEAVFVCKYSVCKRIFLKGGNRINISYITSMYLSLELKLNINIRSVNQTNIGHWSSFELMDSY